jgi:hypothetical protein
MDVTTQQRLMEERSRALATVLLTRRTDVTVHDVARAGDEPGIDVSVRLQSEKPGLRQFGVQLRWGLAPFTEEQGNAALRSQWKQTTRFGPFPFPVVAFLFTMQDDGAWYTWVAEPVVTEDGKAQLPLRTEPDCQQLTNDSLATLLDRVDKWYDVHYAGLTAVVLGGKRSSKRE